MNFSKNKTLKDIHNMPNMAMTLNGWEIPLTLTRITQNVIEGDLVTTKQVINFAGVWQPLKLENLMSKSEGQRAWEWYWLHSRDLELKIADRVEFRGSEYKVMSKKDYSLNGYIEYELVKDYQNE